MTIVKTTILKIYLLLIKVVFCQVAILLYRRVDFLNQHPEPRLLTICNGIGLSLSLQYVYMPGTLNPYQKLT